VAVDEALSRARAPPPPVAARRQRVLVAGGPAAAAILGDPMGEWPVHAACCSCRAATGPAAAQQSGSISGDGGDGGSVHASVAAPLQQLDARQWAQAPHDPAACVSFREFAEWLVRVAARRYPAVPSLARCVQTVLQQHVVPLTTAARQQPQQQLAAPVGASSGVAAGLLPMSGPVHAPTGASGVSETTWERQLGGKEVVAYLRARGPQLRMAFGAVASSTSPAPCATCSSASADGAAAWRHTTARAVLRRLAASGALAAVGLSATAVAGALLEVHLRSKDAQEPR
jgi:hypothetical protein